MSDQAQVELASLRLGLNTELASENFYACFVLPQRRGQEDVGEGDQRQRADDEDSRVPERQAQPERVAQAVTPPGGHSPCP